MAASLTLLSESDLRRLLDGGDPAMVEFYSPNCPHCPSLEPTIERLAREWGDRVTVGQLNILEAPRVSKQWTVMSTPTVIFFRGGAEVARLTGVQGYRQYERELKSLVLN